MIAYIICKVNAKWKCGTSVQTMTGDTLYHIWVFLMGGAVPVSYLDFKYYCSLSLALLLQFLFGLFLFLRKSLTIAQAGHKLTILLPQPHNWQIPVCQPLTLLCIHFSLFSTIVYPYIRKFCPQHSECIRLDHVFVVEDYAVSLKVFILINDLYQLDATSTLLHPK
jgi:hypothetical protein